MSEPDTKRPRLTSSDSALEDEHALILEDLDKCQLEIDKINEAAAEEVLKVEQKYSQIRKPHLQRRKEIIDRIDDFWFSALINHPFLRSIIDELDEECLLYLRNFEVEDREDIQNGYRFKFYFHPNPFFSNEVLIKEYDIGGDEPHTTSTKIQWQTNMDPKERRKKQNGTVGKKSFREDHLSFFEWFQDDEILNEEVADHLKDELWFNPVQYYVLSDAIAVDDDEGNEEEEYDEGDNLGDEVELIEEEEEEAIALDEGEDDAAEEILEEEESGAGELAE